MTDKEHASAIQAAVQALNEKIAKAHDAGLEVDISIEEITTISSPVRQPLILAVVKRLI